MSDDPLMVTRRNLRHYLIRRRNERIFADPDALDLPLELSMHPGTRDDLLRDSDRAEEWTMDWLGDTFMGIPIRQDETLDEGVFVVRWP